MNELAQIGKKRTILLSISILLVSLHTIYYYHSLRPELDEGKLKQQIIRFVLTIVFLILIYLGKNWARKIFAGLLSLGLIFAVLSLFAPDVNHIHKIPMVIMAIIYGLSIQHFGFSRSYSEYMNYKNREKE